MVSGRVMSHSSLAERYDSSIYRRSGLSVTPERVIEPGKETPGSERPDGEQKTWIDDGPPGQRLTSLQAPKVKSVKERIHEIDERFGECPEVQGQLHCVPPKSSPSVILSCHWLANDSPYLAS